MDSYGNIRFTGIQGSHSLIWDAFVKQIHCQLLIELSLKTGESWLQLSWIIFFSYNGGPIEKMMV